MKIALCNVQEFNPTIGGIERVSVSLAECMLQRGVEIIFVACRKSPFSKSYSLPAQQFFLPDSDDYTQRNVSALRTILLEEKVDILVNQNSHSSLYNRTCFEAREGTGVKLISALHFSPDGRIKGNRHRVNFRFLPFKENVVNLARDLCTRPPFKAITMHGPRRMMRDLYNRSDRVVLLSNQFRQSYIQISGIKESKRLTAINNMLSFPYEAKEYPKKKQILYCGRLLFSQKRPDRVLYAWRQIQDELPDWNLVFVGDGSFKEKMLELTEKMHLQRVEFVGFANPIKYYKESAILCLSSNHEGWPLVLMEAMQYGCVPVAFDSYASIYDIIRDGETGILVKPFNIKGFAQSISGLAQSPDLPLYAHRAISSMEQFLPETITDHWISLFNEVLKEEKTPFSKA